MKRYILEIRNLKVMMTLLKVMIGRMLLVFIQFVKHLVQILFTMDVQAFFIFLVFSSRIPARTSNCLLSTYSRYCMQLLLEFGILNSFKIYYHRICLFFALCWSSNLPAAALFKWFNLTVVTLTISNFNRRLDFKHLKCMCVCVHKMYYENSKFVKMNKWRTINKDL